MPHNQNTTSINSMPFNKNFEAQVNDNMSSGSQSASYDSKAPMQPCSPTLSEAADGEYNEKRAMKDQGQHHLPPRFSTIFDTKGPAPATPTRAFESYPQQPARKSGGVYLAKPLFWALFAVILFETAVLFAYTVIGLVNNMGVKLVHTNSAGAIVAGCDCNAQPINISPNFFMAPGSQAPVADMSSSITSSTSQTSSSSATPVPGVNASQLADIMNSVGAIKTSESTTHMPSTSIKTVTPSQETVESTTVLTVDPSGSTISPRPTVTSTKFTRDAAESTVSTTATSDPSVAFEKQIRPIATNEAGIVVSAFDVFSHSPSSTPTISITLKSHAQKVDKPKQESESDVPSSTTTPAAAEPSEEVSPSLSPSTSEITEATPAPDCNKSHHMWGASGKIWGARVCGKPLAHTAVGES